MTDSKRHEDELIDLNKVEEEKARFDHIERPRKESARTLPRSADPTNPPGYDPNATAAAGEQFLPPASTMHSHLQVKKEGGAIRDVTGTGSFTDEDSPPPPSEPHAKPRRIDNWDDWQSSDEIKRAEADRRRDTWASVFLVVVILILLAINFRQDIGHHHDFLYSPTPMWYLVFPLIWLFYWRWRWSDSYDPDWDTNYGCLFRCIPLIISFILVPAVGGLLT
jgi:hypothetical protein